MTEGLPQFSVRPGVCRRSGEESESSFASSECRLTSSECDGQVFGLTFISGMDQWNKPGPYASCPSQTALLAMPLGQCAGSQSVVCAPNAASCADDELFVGPHTSSTTTSSSPVDCSLETTPFGSCGGGECRWSPEHCPSSSDNWTFPNEECTCDKVHVGACVNTIHNDFVICAVDQEACNPDISYYVPVDRVGAELGIACTLCRGRSVDTNNGNTEALTSSTLTGNNNSSNSGSSSPISVGGVAVALLAGCVVFVAAVIGAAHVYRRKYPPPLPKKKRTLPATVISNTQAVEEDDVSVL